MIKINKINDITFVNAAVTDFSDSLWYCEYRNPQGHTKGLNWEMGDPDNEKMILIGSCTTLINTLDRDPEYGIINSTN